MCERDSDLLKCSQPPNGQSYLSIAAACSVSHKAWIHYICSRIRRKPSENAEHIHLYYIHYVHMYMYM